MKNLETMVKSLYFILVKSPCPVNVSSSGIIYCNISFKKISLAIFG